MLTYAEVFDVCHRFLEECSTAGVGAVRCDATPGGGQARVGLPRVEYGADFAAAGAAALRPWPRRLELFELFYLRRVAYKDAVAALKVRNGTFDYWCFEVRRAVGKELLRRGLFPPGRYLLRTRPGKTDSRGGGQR